MNMQTSCEEEFRFLFTPSNRLSWLRPRSWGVTPPLAVSRTLLAEAEAKLGRQFLGSSDTKSRFRS